MKGMKRVIIVGSPRSNGRSAHLAEMLFEASIDERPEDELFLVPLSEIEVGPCIGCNACRTLSEVAVQPDDAAKRNGRSKSKSTKRDERIELRPRCIFDDDMQTVYDLLDDADELVLVSPIYFSGAPAPLKCLLDRMQPYFWANITTGWKGSAGANDGKGSVGAANEKGSAKAHDANAKAPDESAVPDGHAAADGHAEDGVAPAPYVPRRNRPLTLHVLGEGGDPHGFDPLVSEVKSSLACAGFRLERVLDWVGKINAEGEITAEATEIDFAPADSAKAANSDNPVGARSSAPANPAKSGNLDESVGARSSATAGNGNASGSAKTPAKKQRPKLDLSAKQNKGKRRG